MELCLTSSEARNICRVRHYEERESPLALDHELHECLGSTAIDDPGLDGMKQTYYPSSLLMS